ncbi:hypothetical protein Tco_0304544 [Tanacetum coccineum]
MRFRIIHQGRVIHSPKIASVALSSEASEYSLDEFADELALIDFSSYPKRDDMTPDDVIEFLLYGDPTSNPTESKVEEFINENTPDMSKEFVLDGHRHFHQKILYGEDFERIDSDSDKTKDFNKSSSSVFKSLSDEFEPGGSSYVEGNDLVCYEDFSRKVMLILKIMRIKFFKTGILVDKNSKVHEPNVLPHCPPFLLKCMLDFDLKTFS